MSVPEDLKGNLEGYLSYLDNRINLEEDVLILASELSDNPDNAVNPVGTKEPIVRVILAYKGAREYFLYCFPELRK